MNEEATRGGGGVVVGVQKNAVEDVEFAEGSVEEDLAVALAHAPVEEDELAVAGSAPDRVRLIRAKVHGVSARNGGVLCGGNERDIEVFKIDGGR